jgi:hypothetical protein
MVFKSTVPNIDFTKSMDGSLATEDSTLIIAEDSNQILV